MNYKLFQGDCLDLLRTTADESINLSVSSPPYNIGKEYEGKQTIADYLTEQWPLIAELYRVTCSTGSVCWQVGNYVNAGEVFPLDIFYYDLFKRAGFKLRNRIVWHFDHGLHCQKRFSGRYETLLWFSKTDDYVFNLDAVRVPSKYPGKRHYKGPNIGKLSGNPLGKNPSDIWAIMAQEWEDGFWNIPNVKFNHPEKTAHPCQFPVELAERCVLAMTNEGDVVLDPYAGVCSTLIAALRHGRIGIGAERNQAYVSIAENRIVQLRDGTLKIRPLGKQVHEPNGKAAELPQEWR